jgi:hypothetical protein
MKPWILGALSIAVTIGLALQSATFAFVVSVEHRLTRLETLAEPRGLLKNGAEAAVQLPSADFVDHVPTAHVAIEEARREVARGDHLYPGEHVAP